ncbi:MAG: C4-dicarboxylate ABC transporter substrate-binding protein [Desulfocapsa sp.]|nr:MAG: C4-dicarboxylate ABC transporter substrate-binding protein [Desulfocapsa sp.]
MKKYVLLAVTLAITILLVFDMAQAETRFVTIGTGGITGVYYPTGGAISKMVNRKKKKYGIRATVESTGGSVFNINAVMNGDLEFGVVQSDRQYQAVNGLGEWKDKGPQKELRAVFSIYPESVTLVVAVDSGIKNIKDLKGKKVNIGNPGSGQRQNAIDALETVGLNYEKDLTIESVKASWAPGLLQDGRIDAFFYTVGHPSAAIKEATSGARKVRFIALAGLDQLLARHPYYTQSVIPTALYPGAKNKKDVKTFGVKATLVTSARIPDEIVYAVTRELFENFDNFKKLYPTYANLTRESMLEGLTAPIHPGAMKYYQEVGLIKK